MALCLPLLFTTSSWADEPQQTAIPIKVQVVKNRQFTDKQQEVGKIIPVDSTDLTFSASEKLIAKYFKDGAYVKKGSVIAALDNTQAKAELDKAETQYAIDQSKLTRMLALVKKQPDSIAKQDIENQKLQTNLAKVDVDQKKTDLQNYQLIAPFDGRLTSFNYSIGSRLDNSDVVITLIKSDPVQVNYSIGQKDLGEAKIGQKVSVKVDAFKDKVFTGAVNYIAPQVDIQSGRIEVHASIKNDHKLLVPGMFANVIQYSSRKVTYPIVSQEAVLVDGDHRYVWLYNGKDVTEQEVQLGDNTNDGYVAIIKGISVGDKVVVAGQQNLKVDSLVKLQSVETKNAGAESAKPVTEPNAAPVAKPSAAQQSSPEQSAPEQSAPKQSETASSAASDDFGKAPEKTAANKDNQVSSTEQADSKSSANTVVAEPQPLNIQSKANSQQLVNPQEPVKPEAKVKLEQNVKPIPKPQDKAQPSSQSMPVNQDSKGMNNEAA